MNHITDFFPFYGISDEATSASVGHIKPVDQQKHVKKEEPEAEDCLSKTTGCIRVYFLSRCSSEVYLKCKTKCNLWNF